MPFEDVLARLADDSVRFVVTGGRAVVFHGYDRAIADLDIVIDPAPDAAGLALRCLESLGFTSTVPLPLDMVVVLRMIDGRGREVDVNVRYLIPFASLLDRAEHFVVDERDVAVISRADLIAIKQRRGRDYDVDDVARLLM
jgi:predicted nucleotidyltransferase